jgi:hypothetical protein
LEPSCFVANSINLIFFNFLKFYDIQSNLDFNQTMEEPRLANEVVTKE